MKTRQEYRHSDTRSFEGDMKGQWVQEVRRVQKSAGSSCCCVREGRDRIGEIEKRRLGERVRLMLLLFMLMLVSCEEKIDWQLEMENELRLIVDAKLTNELGRQMVKLSLPIYEINGEEKPYSGAKVYMTDGDNIAHFSEDPEHPGIYLSDSLIKGEPGNMYGLYIKAEEYTFTALAYMENISAIRYPDTISVSDQPKLYEINFLNESLPSNIKLELDWSHVPGYDTLPASENHAVIYHYNFGPLSVDVNELFSPQRERVYVPPGTIGIITKESMSEGYAEFMRGIQSETAWNGGLFDVKSGDAFTNLSQGALGYFAAVSVLRDTVEL